MQTCALTSVMLFLAAAAMTSASAQTHTYPTPYPAATAAGHDWYTSRQPLYVSGSLYYPAGAERHFNGDVMIQSGTIDDVPIYADTSVEPYSEFLVPIGRGLVQPYERRREGELAGTTGSRAPSFPVRSPAEEGVAPGQAWPGQPRQPAAPRTATAPEQPAPPAEQQEAPGHVVTARPPQNNRGIWIRYQGSRWDSAGEAVERDATFTRVGEYRGFPVYSRAGATQEIFIPTRDDMLAPYRKTAN